MLQLVECPRDAMQGLHDFIATETKIAYIQQLLKVGFHTIDFGSFVSPKAIPQMRDTAEVLAGLDLSSTTSKLLCIVANERGATEALTHAEIEYIGYPFSISETFQLRNTQKTIAESLDLTRQMLDLVNAKGKKLVVYLSMAFGNPYGDEWSAQLCLDFAGQMRQMGVEIISLADTVGTADSETATSLFAELTQNYPDVVWGAHFHSNPARWEEKIAAAYAGGCRRFDGALKGFGGCPFAKDELVGNIAMENLIGYIESRTDELVLDKNALNEALLAANGIFVH